MANLSTVEEVMEWVELVTGKPVAKAQAWAYIEEAEGADGVIEVPGRLAVLGAPQTATWSPRRGGEGRLVVRWDVSEWRESHGAGPRGRGTWAFRQRGMTPGGLLWSPANLTYAEAKRWAREELGRRGHRGLVELVVCS